MYMIKLVWEKDKEVRDHGIVVVPRLPDKHVTKWLVEEIQIYVEGEKVRDADLFAENRAGERWFADPRRYVWKKLKPQINAA